MWDVFQFVNFNYELLIFFDILKVVPFFNKDLLTLVLTQTKHAKGELNSLNLIHFLPTLHYQYIKLQIK